MKLKLLFVIGLVYYAMDCWAQKEYSHFEAQAGYELFPDLKQKSGVTFGLGGRYNFNDRYFAAALLQYGMSIGNFGNSDDLFDTTDYSLREYMIGVGPGMYLFNWEDGWVYADVLLGYGRGLNTDIPDYYSTGFLKKFAGAVQVGIEYVTVGDCIVGANISSFLLGGKFRASIGIKCGLLLDFW